MRPSRIYDPLLDLASRPGVTDVLVNGHQEVWVDSGLGLVRTESPFFDAEALAEAARQLIAAGDRHLDLANPCADVSLGLMRVHATLASGISQNTLLSIRIHRPQLLTLTDLVAKEFCSEAQAEELHRMVLQRKSFLVSGPTGCGKTTLLRALLAEAAPDRIILLEDVAELLPIKGHVIALQTRQANIEGRGQLSLERLLREALRMRPDRLVIGEVRGAELAVLLQALNTGHAGAATIHANSSSDVANRLMAIGQMIGLEPKTTEMLSRSAFDFVLQLGFAAHGRVLLDICPIEEIYG